MRMTEKFKDDMVILTGVISIILASILFVGGVFVLLDANKERPEVISYEVSNKPS